LELTKELIFSITTLTALAILLLAGKITSDQFFDILWLLLGTILGVGYGYARARKQVK